MIWCENDYKSIKNKPRYFIGSIKTVDKCKYNNILKLEILHSDPYRIIKVQKLP